MGSGHGYGFEVVGAGRLLLGDTTLVEDEPAKVSLWRPNHVRARLPEDEQVQLVQSKAWREFGDFTKLRGGVHLPPAYHRGEDGVMELRDIAEGTARVAIGEDSAFLHASSFLAAGVNLAVAYTRQQQQG